VITSVKNKTSLMEFGKVIFHFLCIVIVSFVLGRKLPQYAAEQSIDEIINYIKQPSLAYISLS
jgi:hypothetical protein